MSNTTSNQQSIKLTSKQVLVHNEKVKLRAALLNNLANSAIAVGAATPVFTRMLAPGVIVPSCAASICTAAENTAQSAVISSNNSTQIFVMLGALIAFVIAFGLHWAGTHFLEGLEE